MKIKNIVLALIAVAVIFGGAMYLTKNKNILSDKQVRNATQVDSHSSQNALDWEGTYSGMTPCADCEGIKTTVTLSKGNKFTYQTQYLGKGDDKVFTDTGTFTWNDNGSVIHLKIADATEGLPDMQVGENKLTLLDGDGKVVVGALADMYVLRKNTAVSNNGTVSKVDKETYEKDKAVFPKTLAGYNRYVIDLPQKENENKFEVEILAGKTDKFDCNNQMLNGTFETKTIEGFGYDYYIFKSDGTVASTMMGCPDDSKTEKFVSRSEKVRYNSKLPVVVFAPKGFEVKYNVWSAGQEDIKAARQ
ncbi:MAG TPA: ecotin family protein [Candidatus Moranbacteria bacterium]|nr:ecotin family protein [Smithellaceae bacterium]HRY28392.1 ecotin family protein [Candidatus Moranbacteria bacterium]